MSIDGFTPGMTPTKGGYAAATQRKGFAFPRSFVARAEAAPRQIEAQPQRTKWKTSGKPEAYRYALRHSRACFSYYGALASRMQSVRSSICGSA
jgi:hypothetical protein